MKLQEKLQQLGRHLFSIVALISLLGIGVGAQAADKVTLTVNNKPTSLMLSVGDAPPFIISAEMLGNTVDVTQLFAQGQNALRVQAHNEGGGVQYVDIQLQVTGSTNSTLNIQCSTSEQGCDSDAAIAANQLINGNVHTDLFLDKTYLVTLNDAPPLAHLNVSYSGLNTGESGYIYLNNFFTGYTLADNKTFNLPQANYTVGLGVSREETQIDAGFFKDNPVSEGYVQYPKLSGRYFEQELTLGAGTSTANMTALVPLGVQNSVKVHLIAVRNSHLPDGTQFTLTDEQFRQIQLRLEATRQDWVKPMSYGLLDWEISYTPPSANLTIPLTQDGNAAALSFVDDAGLTLLKETKDLIFVVFNNATGAGGAELNGGLVANATFITPNETLANANGTAILTIGTSLETGEVVLPAEGVMHEVFHAFEQWQRWHMDIWPGMMGMDGAHLVGYKMQPRQLSSNTINPYDWYDFIHKFVQGKVIELNEHNPNESELPASPATSCTSNCRFYGAFHAVRLGLGNMHPLLQSGGYTVRNSAYSNSYLNQSGNISLLNSAQASNTDSAKWVFDRITEPNSNDLFFHIRASGNSDAYLQLNTSSPAQLVVEPALANDYRAQWHLEGYRNNFKLKNRSTNQYLYLTNSQNLALSTFAENPNMFHQATYDWIYISEPSAIGSSSSAVSSSISSASSSTYSSSSSSSAISSSSSSSSSSESSGSCTEMCKWYNDPVRPLCENQSQNWGWENNQSCIGRMACEAQGPYGGGVELSCSTPAASSSSVATNAPTMCNWYGSNLPICQNTDNGWSNENGVNCISRTVCGNFAY